jgi:hypothetical protein
MFWETEKSLAPIAIRTPYGPVRIMKSVQFKIQLTRTLSFLFYFFRFCNHETVFTSCGFKVTLCKKCTGVGKSRFTVVRMEKRHAGCDYYNSFINNNKKTNNTNK